MLAQYDVTGPILAKEFLMFLDQPPLRSAEMRARLLDLWLRAEPKPVGGSICGLNVDDEFGVLHWLLSGQVVAVFAELIDTCREDLERFAIWLLGKARPFAQYLTSDDPFSSFVVYAFGRPRYRVRVRLALELEKAALDLGLTSWRISNCQRCRT